MEILLILFHWQLLKLIYDFATLEPLNKQEILIASSTHQSEINHMKGLMVIAVQGHCSATNKH